MSQFKFMNFTILDGQISNCGIRKVDGGVFMA